MKIFTTLIYACLSLSLLGCDMTLNSAPPSYIKDVTVYKEGSDGVVVYVVLADHKGAMTTASGALDLTISEEEHSYILYSNTIPVDNTSFQKAKVGMGAFEHEVILYSLGRIPYSSFNTTPKDKSLGKVSIEFKTNTGKVIKGENSFMF